VARQLFLVLNRLVLALEEATRAGTSFVFGYVGGGPPPFQVQDPGASFVFAFQALPLVLVIGALSAVLFHWGLLPRVVGAFARALQKALGIGGALGLGASSTVFLGMVEAPLVIKPYLRVMTRSELFALMTVGMTCIAGTVMVLYSTLLRGVIPDPLGHILAASLVHVVAGITVARLMVPETEPATEARFVPERAATSTMDAVAKGTVDGLHLFLNIAAVLVVMVALVHLVNQGLAALPAAGGSAVTLQRALGAVMAPVVWLFGIPWEEAPVAGQLMGTKTVLNELLAFVELARLPAAALGPRTRLVLTYALCSFANVGSVGILVGSLGTLAPERRAEVAGLGARALVAGTLATCLSGAVIGLLA
jgi:CNT family concentrative nucleoside transporter